MTHLSVLGCFLDGGYIAMRLYCCCFFWPDNYEYANCRNTGSLAGDLAETYFVLFMTRIEYCIIWKGFSMCSNDKCFTEIQFYANTLEYMQNFVSLIFIWPWFPALSLGYCCINECGSNDCDVCDLGYPAFSLAF